MNPSASVILSVKVVPGASRTRVAGRYGDGVKVQVAAAPEKGKANAAVVEVLSAWLGVRPNQVQLITGPTNPRKQFRISGLDRSTLTRKLTELAQ